jgi:hypothetical protein
MPPNSRLPAVLTTQDLALAELCSARLDGEIYALGDAWCPIDVSDGPANRARTLTLLMPSAAVAERASAAWIYGLAPEPACHEVHLDSRARRHVAPSVRLHVREVNDPFADTLDFEGVRVTAPLRTAVDLALCRHQLGDPEEARLIALLATLVRYGGRRDIDEPSRRCELLNSVRGQRAIARFTAVQKLFEDQKNSPGPEAPIRR